MSVRWRHCIDHADTKQKPLMRPDCLLGVVPQPTDSRLSETNTDGATSSRVGQILLFRVEGSIPYMSCMLLLCVVQGHVVGYSVQPVIAVRSHRLTPLAIISEPFLFSKTWILPTCYMHTTVSPHFDSDTFLSWREAPGICWQLMYCSTWRIPFVHRRAGTWRFLAQYFLTRWRVVIFIVYHQMWWQGNLLS